MIWRSFLNSPPIHSSKNHASWLKRRRMQILSKASYLSMSLSLRVRSKSSKSNDVRTASLSHDCGKSMWLRSENLKQNCSKSNQKLTLCSDSRPAWSSLWASAQPWLRAHGHPNTHLNLRSREVPPRDFHPRGSRYTAWSPNLKSNSKALRNCRAYKLPRIRRSLCDAIQASRSSSRTIELSRLSAESRANSEFKLTQRCATIATWIKPKTPTLDSRVRGPKVLSAAAVAAPAKASTTQFSGQACQSYSRARKSVSYLRLTWCSNWEPRANSGEVIAA